MTKVTNNNSTGETSKSFWDIIKNFIDRKLNPKISTYVIRSLFFVGTAIIGVNYIDFSGSASSVVIQKNFLINAVIQFQNSTPTTGYYFIAAGVLIYIFESLLQFSNSVLTKIKKFISFNILSNNKIFITSQLDIKHIDESLRNEFQSIKLKLDNIQSQVQYHNNEQPNKIERLSIGQLLHIFNKSGLKTWTYKATNTYFAKNIIYAFRKLYSPKLIQIKSHNSNELNPNSVKGMYISDWNLSPKRQFITNDYPILEGSKIISLTSPMSSKNQIKKVIFSENNSDLPQPLNNKIILELEYLKKDTDMEVFGNELNAIMITTPPSVTIDFFEIWNSIYQLKVYFDIILEDENLSKIKSELSNLVWDIYLVPGRKPQIFEKIAPARSQLMRMSFSSAESFVIFASQMTMILTCYVGQT